MLILFFCSILVLFGGAFEFIPTYMIPVTLICDISIDYQYKIRYDIDTRKLVWRKQMKKLFSSVLVVLLALTLTACSGGEKAQDGKGAEIALITDVGTIDDRSFNQGSYEGVKQYGDENKVTYTYYRPVAKDDEAYFNEIEKAITEGGAKVVVMPGFLFANAAFRAQQEFPDVNFIFVDGAPSETPQSEPVIGPNMYSVVWEEQQAGFLAGYAAVKDGYTKLGYIGGMKVPAVEKFGLGYVYGANHAAEELGITVDMMYKYSGTFEASQEVQMLASGWYASGTEVIFVSAGGAGPSVFKAAEDKEAKVIGVDVDQAGESETIITSALKELQLAVYEGLKAHYDGKFPGGTQHAYNINDDGVGLPKNFDRFKTFKQEDLDKVIADMKADKDGVTSAIKKQHADDFSDVISDPILKNINITFIK